MYILYVLDPALHYIYIIYTFDEILIPRYSFLNGCNINILHILQHGIFSVFTNLVI